MSVTLPMPVPAALLPSVLSDITSAADAESAMRAAVERLAASVAQYSWVGVYLLDGDELVLGPFVGAPSPHTRIPLAARGKTTIVVHDVNADPRYLACSLETKSEIVVPIMRGDRVLGEIDIDSHTPGAFGAEDRRLLEAVAEALSGKLA
jgi:GAF domain-containing protein